MIMFVILIKSYFIWDNSWYIMDKKELELSGVMGGIAILFD